MLTIHKFFLSTTALASALLLSRAADKPDLSKLPPPVSRPVTFERDIEPIFREQCLKCHGPEKQKNGFRLDRKSEALAGGDSGPSILPGKSAESRLVHNVAGLDPDTVMPPKGPRLSPEQIGLLRRWIDQGAQWPDANSLAGSASTNRHWSFIQPTRPPLPSVKNGRWLRNPIDNFILARLERERIKPSPEAKRVALLRRVTLDLTGLPPKPEETHVALNDKSPDWYEKVVDRLLASGHFGEQWARHWLDLARYADSDGYEKDFYRPHAWRWRNWVIDSINRDQPFDEFTREQIAGDLIPNATVEQQVATGFHRNTLLNREGGVDIEEDRVKAVVDRVSTIGTAWLGLTVGCAECHSHKYDPISQKEFYQLYAFFNSTEDRDIKAPLPAQLNEVREKESELTQAKRVYLRNDDAEMERWAHKVAALEEIWFVPQQEDYDLPTFGANNGANLYPQEDGSFLVTGMIENKTHYIMMLNTRLKGITGIRVEAMTDEMLPRLGPGWAANGNFVLSELRVEASSLKEVNQLKSFPIEKALADYSQKDLEIEKAIDGDEKTGWAVDMPQLPMHAVDRCAVFVLKDDVGYDSGTRLKVSLVQQHGKSHTLGRVRVSYTTAERATLAAQIVPQRIRDLAKVPREKRTLDEQVTLKRYYDATFRQDSAEFLAYTRAMADSPGIKGEVQSQTLVERKRSRATHIHLRGNFLDKGAEVEPGTLSVLHAFQPRGIATARQGRTAELRNAGTASDAQSIAERIETRPKADRLDLANWLVEPRNPLTARVAMNQLWAQLFGNGLVTTLGDFGNQGERPSHPELLDWLATEFIARNWSRKQMIRLMVTSAAYRQSSAVRADLQERDALNRLVTRQNRFRLNAENARDQYLAASGLLDESIGGASVKPDSRRRGLYLQYKRSFPEYLLAAFDAPNTTQSCPKRERSNTPLQSLTLLNDREFMKCARALGNRLAAFTVPDGIGEAFERCVGRRPNAGEVKELRALFDRSRAYYETQPEAAGKLVADTKAEPGQAPKLAAWIVVARTILNMDEVLTRE